jgi:glycolate oxidase
MPEINRLAEAAGIKVAQSFHAGDGNLHPVLIYNGAVLGEEDRAHHLADDILKMVVREGGSISGEHGVGSEKLGAMCWQFTTEELATMHAIKSAFDPAGILNPGKAVPTLHRCAEFGAMHIHKESVPFPDLPRF